MTRTVLYKNISEQRAKKLLKKYPSAERYLNKTKNIEEIGIYPVMGKSELIGWWLGENNMINRDEEIALNRKTIHKIVFSIENEKDDKCLEN